MVKEIPIYLELLVRSAYAERDTDIPGSISTLNVC